MRTSGNQIKVLRALRRSLWSNHDDTTLLLVTGAMGTGKSFVLRTLARVLSNQMLNAGHDAIPLFIPLQDYHEIRPQAVWSDLLAKYVKWASDVAGHQLRPDDIESCLRTQRTVLILDSVDEFLLNNRLVTAGAFRRFLHTLRQDHRQSGKVTIVLGVRLEEPALKEFVEDADRSFEVRPLTVDEALAAFRGVQPVIDRVHDEGLLQVLLTPLILRAVEDVTMAELDEAVLDTHAGLLGLAVRTIIRKARLHNVLSESNQINAPIGWSPWYSALTIVAFVHAAQRQQPLVPKSIVGQAELLLEEWRAHDWPRDLRLRDEVLGGFGVLSEERTCTDLLSKSVFFPLAEQSFRFQHREWYDFLFGRYLAWCISSVHLKQLTKAAFTLEAYRLAAQELSGRGLTGFDCEFVEQAVEQFDSEHGHIALGNVGAVIGNSLFPVSPGALDRLAEYLTSDEARRTCVGGDRIRFSKAGDLTLFSTLGFRALKKDPTDPSHAIIIDTLRPLLRNNIERSKLRGSPDRPDVSGNDAVLASLSWCYLSGFPAIYGVFDDLGEWPGLYLTEEEEREVIDFQLAKRIGERFELLPVHHTIQMAFLSNQRSVFDAPIERPPSIVHYLFTLSLAAKHGCLVRELNQGLKELIRIDGEYARVVRSHPLPTLATIFEICRSNIGL